MNTAALIVAFLTQGIIAGITLYCFYRVLKKPETK